MTAGLVTRLGTTADVPAILALMQDAFDPRYGEAWSGSQLAGSLAIPGTWAMVASDNGGRKIDADDGTGIIGFALTRLVLDSAELLLVAVGPHWRGCGGGKALIAAAVAQASERGGREMFLEVRDGNDAAQGLYRACGFSVIGRRKDYYSGATIERFDAITMRTNIAGQLT